mgnify:FL=1
MKRWTKNLVVILLMCLIIIGTIFTVKLSRENPDIKGNNTTDNIQNNMDYFAKEDENNKPERPDNNMDDANRPEMPSGDMNNQSNNQMGNDNQVPPNMNNGTRPEKPDDSMNGTNRPEIPNDDMNNNDNTSVNNRSNKEYQIKTIYYVIFSVECLVFSILLSYLIMSHFNKKTFKETFKNSDKKIISALLIIILTGGFTYLVSCISKNNLKIDESTSNNTKHGSDETVSKDDLYTIEDVKEDDEKYEINSDTQGKAKEGTYAKLFNKETIQDVKISIDENNWNYLLQNAIDKPTVLASSVSIGDDTVKYVGIKTKGNLTLKEVWNSSSDRFSFTINFGKYINTNNGYIDKQNLYGLRKVALNNIYGDATLMKEYLSYELMTKMGIPTPEYSLINLYINDEFYGVYMMVESIDSSLTQRTLGEKSDYLVKPESSGGDLIYDNSLDEYINDDGEFDFSSIIYDNSENIIYPNDKSNPLYKYNGLWKNDEDTFEDIVDMLPTIFKWMKTLNELNNTNNPNTDDYKLALEEIIDVDSLIRYFAVNTYLVNLDSYQSEKMQNYALYINETGRATIIPWDYNYSFGVYGLGSASDVINFDIYNPVINTTLKDRPLLNVILQNDEYKTLYEKYLNDITIIASEGGTTSDGDTYEENNFATILNKYNKLLNNIYGNDPTAFYTLDEYNKATTSLKELIEQRSEAVLNQLNGNNEKVTTDINLRDMGESVGGIGNDFQDKRA